MQNLLYDGTINSLFKPQFYQTQNWEIDAKNLIKQAPKSATVASQNSLLPHLSHQPKFNLLPEIGEAEYIAVDLHDGPNKYSPINLQQTTELINQSLAD